MTDYTSSQPADCCSECAAKHHGDWPPHVSFTSMIWVKKTREQAKARNDCAKKDSYDVTK